MMHQWVPKHSSGIGPCWGIFRLLLEYNDYEHEKKKSGNTSYYAEHDADVIGNVVLVFNIGYQSGRYQETN